MLRDLTILWLLLCPVEIDLPKEATPEDWAALKQLSFTLEICSPGVEHWREDWAAEVRWCRDQLAETWHCPPLAWAAYLPEHGVCLSRRDFALRRLGHLHEQCVSVSQFDRHAVAIADQQQRAEVWRLAALATDRKASATGRRQALYLLVPHQIESGGELPCHVTAGTFYEID